MKESLNYTFTPADMDMRPIANKLPVKESTKRILHTIKKCRRIKHTNAVLVHLLSLLPKPNPTIDRSVLALAYIEKLRSKIDQLTKKQAELLALQENCNCSETGSEEDVSICSSDSVSANTNFPPTHLTTSTNSETHNVRIVVLHGHVTVTVTTTWSNKSLLLKFLSVIQSHDAEVVHANLNKEDETCCYLIHAKVIDAEKFLEKGLLSELQALTMDT